MSKSETRIHISGDGSSSIIALEQDDLSISMMLPPETDQQQIESALEELRERVARVDGSEGSR